MSDETEIALTSFSGSFSDAIDNSIKQSSNVNDEQNESIQTEENNSVQEIIKMTENASVLNFKEVSNKENENGKTAIENVLVAEKTVIDDPLIKITKVINESFKTVELNEKHKNDNLKKITEDSLLDILKETKQMNFYLLKENEIYEYFLNKDERVQSYLDRVEMDEDLSTQNSFILSYPAKCYFVKTKLEHMEKELEKKKTEYTHKLKNLNFEHDSLNTSLNNLRASQEMFNKNIRVGGRHPVTKKISLQKVAKYFEDSIRTKMALSNRYKTQIESDIMERNKILSQFKAQEKRLVSLDMTEFQRAQFEHEKSCKQLAMYKEQLGKFKAKFSPLLQSIAEMKKDLEREQNEMLQMKNAVSKLEHLKGVMLTEKTRNDQKVLELKASMRNIKLDPRRHNVPEVIDYADCKRENGILMKNINKWQKKVKVAQQEKILYLNSLAKKKKVMKES